MKIRKAVIPAAGFGTRFLPATKALPKEMLPIVDKPSIQYIVEEALNSGIEEILIIVGRDKSSIINHFDRSVELELTLEKNQKEKALAMVREITNMVNIHFIRQKEALGLGHAILQAKTFVGNEPFAVLLGDDIVDHQVPCLKQLIDSYDQYQCSVVGVQSVEWDRVSKYGIVDGKEIASRTYEVKDMVEKPAREEAPSNVAILGRYILTPDIFGYLEETEPGAGNEIQLTDGIKKLCQRKRVLAYNFEGRRYDAGDKLGFLEATVEFGLKNPEIGDAFHTYLKNLIQGENNDNF
jgi:UTP--glucose-1-phosphate uridylyltransferase